MGKFYIFFLFVLVFFSEKGGWLDSTDEKICGVIQTQPGSQMCVQNTWGRNNKSWLTAASGTAWNETCRFCMKSSLYLEPSLMEEKKVAKLKKKNPNSWASKHKICPTLCKRYFSSLNLNFLSVIGRSFRCKQFIIVDTPEKYLR